MGARCAPSVVESSSILRPGETLAWRRAHPRREQCQIFSDDGETCRRPADHGFFTLACAERGGHGRLLPRVGDPLPLPGETTLGQGRFDLQALDGVERGPPGRRGSPARCSRRRGCRRRPGSRSATARGRRGRSESTMRSSRGRAGAGRRRAARSAARWASGRPAAPRGRLPPGPSARAPSPPRRRRLRGREREADVEEDVHRPPSVRTGGGASSLPQSGRPCARVHPQELRTSWSARRVERWARMLTGRDAGDLVVNSAIVVRRLSDAVAGATVAIGESSPDPLPPRRRRPRRASILDVAALAGVSASTVSRSLRGHSSISAATRQRVHEAAQQLSYSASPQASGLASGRTLTIGVVVPFVTRWFFVNVVGGRLRGAARGGLRRAALPPGHRRGPRPLLRADAARPPGWTRC